MSWRDDPSLVRREDGDQAEEQEQLDPGWDAIFQMVQGAIGEPRGWNLGERAMRMAFKQAALLARSKVAEDPEGNRRKVVEVCQLVTAALRIEPPEVYPGLQLVPAAPGDERAG